MQKGGITAIVPLDRLQRLVREVSDIHPWYKAMIGDGGAKTISGLDDLPLVTAEVMEAYYDNPSADPALSVYRTSGTGSGRRKTILYSAEDDGHYIGIKTKLFGELLADSGCKRAMADMGTGHAANTALAIFDRLGLEGEAIPFERPIDEHVARLLAFKPDVLYTMPSILEHLVHASDNPQAYGIRKIILVGEIATPAWQHNMCRLFGLAREDIIDTYGSIEVGTIAHYDHRLGRYLLADGLYAEGIDAAQLGEEVGPLDEDERILVLTSFVRHMLPCIRLVTYDVVRDFRPVTVNGEERQSFRAIVKRVGRELKHGEKISLYDIEQAVCRHVRDAAIRVRARNNALVVMIKSKADIRPFVPLIQADIRERIPEIGTMIRGGLLDDIRVEVVAGDEALARGPVKSKKIYE